VASLLSNACKVLSIVLLSRLTSYIDKITGDHQCGFRRNRSATDQIFSIRQVLGKKWECNGTVHQLYLESERAYDSMTREILCNILIGVFIPMIIVGKLKRV